jgi:cbb3-type cytochrome oxidase subunit 3
MLREFMSKTPMLALSVATLIGFVLFFLGVIVYAFTRSKSVFAQASQLPLEDSDGG